MWVKNLLQFFIFCIILKTTFSNVTDLSSSTTEFEVSESTTQFEINSTSYQLTTEQVGEKEVNKSLLRPKCNVSSDCPNSDMLCTVRNICRCPTFHFWNATSKLCSVNVTDLLLWFRHSTSNDSETLSQSAQFRIDESGPYKILISKWSDFPTTNEEEIGPHFYNVFWPTMLGFFIIGLLYAAIILNYM